jgi:uncharacterized membrane protein YbaN (DUF454 family)
MPDRSSDDTTDERPLAPAELPGGGWRDRVRSKPGLGHAYRGGVFVLGLAFVALGVALAVLPGPLTIPPVLVGIWIWSTEFRFAERLFESFKRKADEAWEHAKAHRLGSALITAGGLAAAGAVVWAVSYYELVDRGRSAVGL